MGDKNQVGLPARRESVKFLKKILRDKRSLDDLFSDSGHSRILQTFAARDRALVRQICATVLRRKGQITASLNKFLQKPLPRKSGDAQEILLVGAAQILFMDVPNHAAIDLSVRLAGYDRNAKHFKGLINAVLRRLSEDKEPAQDIILNTPDWLLKNWQKQFSKAQITSIAEQHVLSPPLDLTCKSDPEKWADKLNALLLPNDSLRLGLDGKGAGSIESLSGFEEGAWWVQDIAASLPVKLIGDVKEKNILDLCAAPGGKSLQLASLGARVTSVDKSANRLKRLEENLTRTGLEVRFIQEDAGKYTPENAPDIILLDAPCSATGTIRRHPDLPYIKNEHSISKLTGLQAKLLSHAAKILEPGGKLVYCTCSLERQEGEDQIEAFLNTHEDFQIKPLNIPESWDLKDAQTPQGFVRTLPSFYADKGGIDGFFIAQLQKTAS